MTLQEKAVEEVFFEFNRKTFTKLEFADALIQTLEALPIIDYATVDYHKGKIIGTAIVLKSDLDNMIELIRSKHG